jgi:hypothetical protein
MTSVSHGQSASDSHGEEGWKEKQRQEHLQCEARSHAARALPQKRDRYIYLENSSNLRDPFPIQEVATVPELLAKIRDFIPQLAHPDLGMRVSATRMGSMHRVYLTGDLPSDAFFLYVSLYLVRHPPIGFRKN